jgi:hypothetical protein
MEGSSAFILLSVPFIRDFPDRQRFLSFVADHTGRTSLPGDPP